MLAFASLAVGVVASLAAPSAHAAPHPVGTGPLTDAVTAPDLPLSPDYPESVAQGLTGQAPSL